MMTVIFMIAVWVFALAFVGGSLYNESHSG